jgi:hypothetical protein
MANVRYHVIYGGEIGGKLDGTHIPIIVTAADVAGSDGASRPSPDNIITAITAAGLHNKKSGVVHKLYSVASLDDKTVATQA